MATSESSTPAEQYELRHKRDPLRVTDAKDERRPLPPIDSVPLPVNVPHVQP